MVNDVNKMNFRYNLDDVPPLLELLLFGLQWLAIAVSMIIIVGRVAAVLHYNTPVDQVQYLQKIFFIVAISTFVQVFWGHRLPCVIGPSTVLLVGITASRGSSINSIYSSILIGGLILSLLSITGLFGHIKKLFTPRVVATVLMLTAITLTPMILNLIVSSTLVSPMQNLCFTLIFVVCMFTAGRYLTGIWKSTLIIWAICIGSALYILLFPQYITNLQRESFPLVSSFFGDINLRIAIDPSILLSFLICFIALAINDLGSIQSLGALLKPDNMDKRVTAGIFVTGLVNILSGILGVIGPVNFSLSPGVIASTGVASRYTLIPTSVGLLALSFLPKVITFMGNIPSVVIGSALIYIMCSPIATGFDIISNSQEPFKFEHGLIIGLPLMLSIIVSYLPANVLSTFPVTLRPILGNGFLIGVLVVFFMEHIVYRRRKE